MELALFNKSFTVDSMVYALNVLMSIGWIAGMGAWSSNGTVWAYGDTFGFAWFVSVTSFLVSFFALSFESCLWVKSKVNVLPEYSLYIWLATSALYTLFTIASAGSISSVTNVCVSYTDTYNSYVQNYNYNYNGYNYNYNYGYYGKDLKTVCDGVYVATAFSWVSFILWGVSTGLLSWAVYMKHRPVAASTPEAVTSATSADTVVIPVDNDGPAVPVTP